MSDQNTALFPACFRVSRDNIGGEIATFTWVINAVQKTVSGSGKLTQSIDPPTDITVGMTGSYVEKDGEINIHAAGASYGASLQVDLRLMRWAGPAEAVSLRWLANNHYFSDENVPAKSIDCFG
ncbi:MAG: DUF1842 domain-containing protein [Thermoanaerobaculia bacterium]|nr:DUF1842 domain-containing protein [Thermoanaerobaculia bacterium]